MGIDWYPFKPKPKADISYIRELAKEQAKAFQAWQSCRTDSDKFHANEQIYEGVSVRLKTLVEFGMSAEHPEFIDHWRVSVIEGCLNFPTQWRQEALATFLPEDLASQVEQWRSWIQSVRLGRKQLEQRLLYVSHISRELHSAWRGVREGARVVRTLTNAWVGRDVVQQLLAEIGCIPEPLVCDRFDEVASISDRKIDQVFLEQQVATLETQALHIQSIIRRWNRNVKKGRTGYWHLISFANFVNDASSPWIDEFFEWAGRWRVRGYGLFLDY